MEDTKDSKDSLKEQDSVMDHTEGRTVGEAVEASVPAQDLTEREDDGKDLEGSKEPEETENPEAPEDAANLKEPEELEVSANLEESVDPEEQEESPEEQEEREWREWKERRQARPRQQENPIREWISDNLRYMLLILAIAIVVVAIVLGVKLFSDRMSREDGGGNSNVSGESQSTAEGSDFEDSGKAGGVTITPDAKASVTVTPTATPTVTPTATPTATPTEVAATTPTVTPTATPAATPTEEPDRLERAKSDVSEVVERYFEALGARDTETLSAYMEQLTEEDRAAVEANQQIGGYSNITVYSYKGAQDNSYVVLASYTYQYQGYDTEIPGLTQLYVFQKEDGKLCIASENTEANLETYINQVLEREDVQQLKNEVQAQYDEVMNNHPELQAYVESLGR